MIVPLHKKDSAKSHSKTSSLKTDRMEKYNPKELEEKVLNFWNKKDIRNKSEDKRKKGQLFSFIEGPPTANAPPHVGHFRGRALKDVVLRYKQLSGMNVVQNAGWDCQGLPVELAVEARLGFTKKQDIEEYGIAKFNKECRKHVEGFIEVWERLSKRLGMWMNFDKAYRTMNNEHIEFGWWTLKQAYEKGMVKKSFRVQHWCPRCETSLSQHEIGQGYDTITGTSVFVKFKVRNKNEFLIIWTTTPWTLPENMAVMVHPDFEYARVQAGKEIWIVAKDLVKSIAGEDAKILSVMKGTDLIGLKYEHPFAEEVPYHQTVENEFPNAHTIIASREYVTLEKGTGLVHCAPGCGPEDNEVGNANNIPAFNPVGENGVFGKEAGRYAGLVAMKDDPAFIDELVKKDILVREEKVTHEYPHCWRCETPVIFIMSPQWYISADEVRDKMVKANKRVDWYPDWTKVRFENWLKGARDWNISRKRYWGTPLPFWECKCGHLDVIGSVKELEKKAGKKLDLKDLHRPYVDDIKIKCSECGKHISRVPEVADVWFDSGVVPGVTFNYLADKKGFEKKFPCDFITEGTDQTRGWYYTLMFANIFTFGKCPYKSVLNQGHLLDADGKKMSKSKGNVVWAETAMNETGSDVYRFFVLWKTLMWNSVNYDEKEIKLVHKLLNSYWNMHNLLRIYTETDNIKSSDFKKAKLDINDEWLLSRTNSVVKEVTKKMDSYDITGAARSLYDFILDDVSRFYVQTVRNRMSAEMSADKLGVYKTLSEALLKATLLLNPFTPFITEQVYQNLRELWNCDEESVHFLSWPVSNSKSINKTLEKKFKTLDRLISGTLSARQKSNIGVKWPLNNVKILTNLRGSKSTLKELERIFKDQTNVKSYSFISEPPKGVSIEYRLNFEVVKEKANIKDVLDVVRKDSPETIWMKANSESYKIGKAVLSPEDFIFNFKTPKTMTCGEFEGGIVFLDTEITDELFAEGFTREVIRQVQTLRKELELERNDEVVTTIECSGKAQEMIEQHMKEFKRVTGTKTVIFDKANGNKISKTVIKDNEISIGIKLA